MKQQCGRSNLLIVIILTFCSVSLASLINKHESIVIKMVGSTEKVENGTKIALSTNVDKKGANIDGDKVSESCRWRWIKKPANSNAQITNDELGHPSFVTDVNGLYEIAPFIIINGEEVPIQDNTSVKIESSAVNKNPIAIAEKNQTVQVLSSVNLNGSKSYDFDGDYLTYRWFFIKTPEGNTAKIERSNSPLANFVPDVEGEYLIGLVVEDGKSKSSINKVTIVATALGKSKNQLPIAKVEDDKFAKIMEVAHLDGSASYDPDGDDLDYLWFIISKPKDSNVEISSVVDAIPYFQPDVIGAYVFGLIVSDTNSKSRPTKITIRVTETNLPPSANAGKDKEVDIGEIVILDGSKSFDKDGDKLIYQWKLISFPFEGFIRLDDLSLMNPSFEPIKHGVYVFELVVSDYTEKSHPSRVVIYVKKDPEKKPLADAGDDFSLILGNIAQLSGMNSRSSDVNNKLEALTFKWEMVHSPEGSSVKIQNSNLPNPTFRPDKSGIYKIQLIVGNEDTTSGPDEVIVLVMEDIGKAISSMSSQHGEYEKKQKESRQPVADAGKNQRAFLTSTVVLNGSDSGHTDGDEIEFSWSFSQKPNGSAAKLLDADTSTPKFSPDVEGIYRLRLKVSNKSSVSEDNVAVKVTPVEFDIDLRETEKEFGDKYKFNRITIKNVLDKHPFFSVGPITPTFVFRPKAKLEYGKEYTINMYKDCAFGNGRLCEPIIFTKQLFVNLSTEEKF